MTDEPGRPPEDRASDDRAADDRAREQRLPAPRPDVVPVTADRFSSPPSARRNDLTPERAAGIVRQSSNARWVGFLAVTIVGLFVIGYYFYELGLPAGLSESRLAVQSDAQQVTAVQRGYNLYEANCSRCHGVNGEGGIGPTLNRQDKLFAHLSPEYLRNVLTVGGRYVCGNPNSLMPVWSNAGNPPGPLNYKQIEDLIAFLRAAKGREYAVLDPGRFEPVVDPATGKEKTFTGWVDPAYAPAPGATPYPACWTAEFASPGASGGASGSAGASGSPAASGSPGASGSAAPSSSGSAAPVGTALKESALNVAFEVGTLSAPADQPFSIEFENKDAGIPHNIEIKDASGGAAFKGEIITGPAKTTYNVPALKAGTYTFICTVHPNMTGTLTVGG